MRNAKYPYFGQIGGEPVFVVSEHESYFIDNTGLIEAVKDEHGHCHIEDGKLILSADQLYSLLIDAIKKAKHE